VGVGAKLKLGATVPIERLNFKLNRLRLQQSACTRSGLKLTYQLKFKSDLLTNMT